MSALPEPQDSNESHGEIEPRQGVPLDGQHSHDAQVVDAVSPPAEASSSPLPTFRAPRPEDSLLLIYADALDDIERTRIATENRVRSLRQVKGMEGTPEEARLAGMVEALQAIEHGAELELKRALRRHPLGPWIKRTVGVGEKQGARLLAAIGDPGTRRTVSQLWAYCGFHVVHDVSGAHNGRDDSDPGPSSTGAHIGSAGVAPRRAKGQKANWSNTARMRARLIAESCIKQHHSPYRAVYDAGREKYAAREITDMHKHNRALRLVAKAVLKDLWIEARSHSSGEARRTPAPGPEQEAV